MYFAFFTLLIASGHMILAGIESPGMGLQKSKISFFGNLPIGSDLSTCSDLSTSNTICL